MDRQQQRDRMTIGEFEKFYSLPPGTLRNPSGRDTRSNKTIGALRREILRKPRMASPKKTDG